VGINQRFLKAGSAKSLEFTEKSLSDLSIISLSTERNSNRKPSMDRISHLRLLAQYNAWMNEKLYAAASKLSATELGLDRKAFFGSILGTLNPRNILLRKFCVGLSVALSILFFISMSAYAGSITRCLVRS
jgi:hypothetical protein